MSQTAVSNPESGAGDRRRFPRHPLAIPVDVVVLRSGIPATIPGRSIDLAEGGLAAIMAGELRVGESVGVEIKLPFGIDPVQAKALVRDQKELCCRLQFLGMPPESYTALQTWTQMVAPRIPEAVAARTGNDQFAAPPSRSAALQTESRRRRQSRKAKWMALCPLATVLVAVLVWWSWQNGWIGVAPTPTAQASSEGQSLQIPGAVMERSLLHRVEPTYPEEALKQKAEGLVVLGATIGPDGTVQQLQPLSGPDVLSRAAVDAVKWWRFEPYKFNGQPTQVRTTIEVDFRLRD
jgi:TonB family protein